MTDSSQFDTQKFISEWPQGADHLGTVKQLCKVIDGERTRLRAILEEALHTIMNNGGSSTTKARLRAAVQGLGPQQPVQFVDVDSQAFQDFVAESILIPSQLTQYRGGDNHQIEMVQYAVKTFKEKRASACQTAGLTEAPPAPPPEPEPNPLYTDYPF